MLVYMELIYVKIVRTKCKFSKVFHTTFITKYCNEINIKDVHFFSPEALGVVSGCIFLVTSFTFIPIVFGNGLMDRESFPHNEVIKSILMNY